MKRKISFMLLMVLCSGAGCFLIKRPETGPSVEIPPPPIVIVPTAEQIRLARIERCERDRQDAKAKWEKYLDLDSTKVWLRVEQRCKDLQQRQ